MRRIGVILRGVGEWRPSELLDVVSLHLRFREALGEAVQDIPVSEDLRRKPLDLDCDDPLPPRLRVYLFNCTDHPSERKAGDYRIQLRLAGQRARERGSLVHSAGALLLLVGFVSAFDVFVLWDAHAHQNFPFSKGIQVGASTVHQAAIHGLAEQQRDVRGAGYQEQVVAARADRLVQGVRRREDLSRNALLTDPLPRPSEPTADEV